MIPDIALDWIRRIEAGFIDDPNDPGGATYAGITAPAVVGLDVDHDGRLDFDIDGDGDVDADDIRALAALPPAERDAKVAGFYNRIWTRVTAGLAAPANLLAFDGAVHHGPGPGVVLVQKALLVAPDGIVGPRTIAEARVTQPFALLRAYRAERDDLFRGICNKRVKSRGFLLGWLNRVALLQAECLRFLGRV